MVACLCHFVISFFRLFAWRYGAAPRRNNAKRKDEITKKRRAKKRKNEKTKSATRNDEKRARKDEKTPCEITPFSSFRMASFRYFVFSPGVISFFRYFAWRFSLFRLFAWRYFVFSPRQNAKRKDEKTKNDMRKD